MGSISVINVCIVITAVFCGLSAGDMYLHSMRGSNNRLNGNGVNRSNNNRMCDTQNNAKGGYVYGPPMYYFAGSQLTIEWTNQHGCGELGIQNNLHCQIIMQYMCGDEVRDGATEDTIPVDPNQYNNIIQDPTGSAQTFGGGMVYQYGMHEPYQYYVNCATRERNMGLFLADQGLGGSTAIFTRQNPGGGRSGFECQEERDYYPYWHPTPWKDVVVLTSDPDRCDFYVKQSENNRGRNYCSNPAYNNYWSCTANGGQWEYNPPNGAPGPECGTTPLSRDNHLGNGINAVDLTYNWTIPNDYNDHCVFRIRYNITTGDYDGWNTFAGANGANSPIHDDPYVAFNGYNLSYAIDTTQTGRTFQDRSFTFAIVPRPSDVLDTTRIFNLNVRGKRGNIVQVYPAVEYDFVPNHLTVRQGDRIHFQWTGGDTNPPGNDGEGTEGTDRSNMLQMAQLDLNLPYDINDITFFSEDQAFLFAFLDQYSNNPCPSLATLLAEDNNNQNTVDRDPRNCAKLNAASRYFDAGLVEVSPMSGNYFFMSSRNNNFSNRSQKSTITVVPFIPIWAIVLVCFGAAVCLLSIVISGLAFWAKARPYSFIGQVWIKLT